MKPPICFLFPMRVKLLLLSPMLLLLENCVLQSEGVSCKNKIDTVIQFDTVKVSDTSLSTLDPAVSISDFAPIKVGNKWRYRTKSEYNMKFLDTSSHGFGEYTIQVASISDSIVNLEIKGISEDTILFQGVVQEVRSTVFNTTRIVIQKEDNVIASFGAVNQRPDYFNSPFNATHHLQAGALTKCEFGGKLTYCFQSVGLTQSFIYAANVGLISQKLEHWGNGNDQHYKAELIEYSVK